jgi:hypothetical protein
MSLNVPIGPLLPFFTSHLEQDQLIHGSFPMAHQIDQWAVFIYSRWFFIGGASPLFSSFSWAKYKLTEGFSIGHDISSG